MLLARFPSSWWLLSAALFVFAIAVMANLAPTLLLPMFYKFRPLEHESLRSRLVALSTRAGVPLLGVYEWAMGEKTPRANAALVGTGRTRRIILSDTLLAAYSEEEIEVVMATELGHHVHRDIRGRPGGGIGAGDPGGFLLCGVGPEPVVADPGADVPGRYRGPAAVAAGGWRDHAGRDTARERPLAAQRTACRRIRARHDGAAGGIDLGDEGEPARRTSRKRIRRARCYGCSTATRPWRSESRRRATRATFNVPP